MQDARKQLVEKLKAANNVMVTVSRDPSVDQLAALLGLTLVLNKQGKHAAAVYSGATPSTIEFLKPEETIEKNTDSLRDFIIALDKNKADKLRYKVEDDVVRIFITPYRTSISKDDFEFSQGDFNVDVVVALGVTRQEDLDESITAHGRILHDAAVASISLSPASEQGLGSINWHEPKASSLSELVTELATDLGPEPFDQQIATALLTGIVAETDRFSNDRTSADTMSASAALMTAGANQQLVASQLQGEMSVRQPAAEAAAGSKDGAIEINHDNGDGQPPTDLPPPATDAPPPAADVPQLPPAAPEPPPPEPPPPAAEPAAGTNLSPGSHMITEPPSLGGQLTANTEQSDLEPVTDPLSLPSSEPPMLLKRDQKPPTPPPAAPEPPAEPADEGLPPGASTHAPPPEPSVPEAPPTSEDHGQTLTELEEAVHSPHVAEPPTEEPATPPLAPEPPAASETVPAADKPDVDAARDQVDRILNEAEAAGATPPSPIKALNAQPLGDELHASDPFADPETDKPSGAPPSTGPQPSDFGAPPPVPPPIPFQFGGPQPPAPL